ncbi:tripartite tricarboxylate transporter substrate binding protein [Bordetella sp. BOR01]|uniref:tripartite tricarboxylate transporter substrate binding protein n=1 Tax=Bordetella sp. BOR01 TaxID=2854779 RepID=UPI001C44E7A7|nr:tripartite tricarboxylate transporter substrate binding protein [Bordetella sp. BOR01]MBV7483796.1 tripartite tricarboxylate transporter substrate binding protein [Bordetella sp. BOR01]
MNQRVFKVVSMILVASAGACMASGAARADTAAGAANFPNHALQVVSGFAPGGATDVVARLIAQGIAQQLGQSVVVENKPGAAGNIGANYVAQSAPDGYTMYLTNATIAMPSLFSSLPFDVRKDFAPVALIGYGPSVFAVNPKLPVRSIQELIDYARRNPHKLNYASGGVGNITHMAMELFIAKTGIDIVHIPYKGGAPSTQAAVAGEVPLLTASITSALGQIKQNTLVPLAVSTDKRHPALPDVPTMQEAGVAGYDASSWYGIIVPAKTPKPVIEKLNQAIAATMKRKDVQEQFIAQGVIPAHEGPGQFGQYIDSEIGKWAELISKAHVTIQ